MESIGTYMRNFAIKYKNNNNRERERYGEKLEFY